MAYIATFYGAPGTIKANSDPRLNWTGREWTLDGRPANYPRGGAYGVGVSAGATYDDLRGWEVPDQVIASYRSMGWDYATGTQRAPEMRSDIALDSRATRLRAGGNRSMSTSSDGGGEFNIGQLLAQQQVTTAISTLFSANQTLMVAQTTAPTKGPFAMAILQGMALGLGQSGSSSPMASSNSQTALLISLLGTSVLTSLVAALNTYNAILGNASATFTTIANGHNAFLTSLTALLSTVSNNNLITTLGLDRSDDGNGTGALLSVMLQNTANTAFVSANPQVTVPFTTGTMDTAFSTLETSFLAWLTSASTNALLAALL